LAATFPPTATIPEGWTVIGAVAPAADPATPVLVDGTVWESPAGYDHFRNRR
jgi:thiamine-monophosphate kinase